MSFSSRDLAILGVGSAIGTVLGCALGSRRPDEGKRLPLATSGMAKAKGDRCAPQVRLCAAAHTVHTRPAGS